MDSLPAHLRNSYARDFRLADEALTLDDWRRLPAVGKSIGTIGNSTRRLWEWTPTYRMPQSKSEFASSQGLQPESAQDSMVKETKSKI